MKTNQEKAQQLYNDWREKHGRNPERVEFAAYCLERELNRLDNLTLEEKWSEAHTTLLINFLRLPIEHQKSLVESMRERKPEVFAPQWKAYPENKPTEIGMYLIIQDGFDAVLLDWWASDMFVDYDDVVAFMPIPKYKP
jgi:hypothetical protein